MSKITQKYKGWARKITVKSNYPNVKLSVKLPRSSTIRIKRDESRKQGDKNSHQRNGTNDRNSKIEDYKIPTPYKEILIALVNRKEGYEALDYLAEKFSIHMGYWTYGRRLKESLQMFRKSNLDFYARKE